MLYLVKLSGGELMKRNNLPKPTEAELAILRILWQRGPSTVREVRDELDKEKPTGYTTVLKFMQIMTEKGLLTRDESQRTHIYQPTCSEEHTQRSLIKDLLDRAFGGSTHKLVAQTLLTQKTSPEEIEEIKTILANYERGNP
jgi:predicted transcriptional regulator